VQDYEETYPYIRFHGASGKLGQYAYVWKNAIRPYLKSLDVLACPSNPYSRTIPGLAPTIPVQLGMNAEGWEVEPEQRMPISYGMNSCATTWIPADDPRTGPPLRLPEVTRPAETFLIGESQGVPYSDIVVHWLWQPKRCFGLFAHPSGKVGNFIFYDGHARSRKWLSTLYPVTRNIWELKEPDPDPENRHIQAAPGCDEVVPHGPDAEEYKNPVCLPYQ
jgi:prepilin-type processing-associated H-X9-DG protein